MTSIFSSVWAHRRGVAVAGVLVVVVLAGVGFLLFKTSSGHELHHHLVASYHHLPRFVRAVLGVGRLGSAAG